MKKCAVIGSINTDMVARTPRFPAPGESIIGSLFQTEFGGKGANQAIALARLGAETRMAGKVGDDLFGRNYLSHFAAEGVNTDSVGVEAGTTTGIADIWVTDSGENRIVSIPGANAKDVYKRQLVYRLPITVRANAARSGFCRLVASSYHSRVRRKLSLPPVMEEILTYWPSR